MYNFCTYFDKNYLSRALVMFDSLKKNCSSFRIFVLCIDDYTYDYLSSNEKDIVVSIKLSELEAADKELNQCQSNRSRVEYFFTLSPCLPLYILQKFPEIRHIAYLDSDLYFYSDPGIIFNELGEKSIYIIPHRFPQEHKEMEDHGTFNVGFQIFKNNDTGIACLNRWRKQCIEWCYDKVEINRYADQKYLDEWPDLYKNELVISQWHGANLAPWNVAGVKLSLQNSRIMVNGQELIFFHFHRLRFINTRLATNGLEVYHVQPDKILKDYIYAPYMGALIRKNRILKRQTDQTQRLSRKYSFKEIKGLLKNGYTFLYINDHKCLRIKWSSK